MDLEFKMGVANLWPIMGSLTNRDLLVVVLFLCRTIVCDSQCPKFAEKPLETRVQDATIVFRAVVVQTHYQVSCIFVVFAYIQKFVELRILFQRNFLFSLHLKLSIYFSGYYSG